MPPSPARRPAARPGPRCLRAWRAYWPLRPCSSPAPETTLENATAQAAVVVRPAPLPAAVVPGYRFPEDSTTIEGWVQRHDRAAIYRHGWGLWAALMAPVVPTRGDTTRVYQTWKTKQELAADLQTQPTSAQAQLLAT